MNPDRNWGSLTWLEYMRDLHPEVPIVESGFSINVKGKDGIFRRRQWHEIITNEEFFIMNDRYQEIYKGKDVYNSLTMIPRLVRQEPYNRLIPSSVASPSIFSAIDIENKADNKPSSQAYFKGDRRDMAIRLIYKYKCNLTLMTIIFILLLIIAFLPKGKTEVIFSNTLLGRNLCFNDSTIGPLCDEDTRLFSLTRADSQRNSYIGFPTGKIQVITSGNSTALCESKFKNNMDCENSCLNGNGTLSCSIQDTYKNLLKSIRIKKTAECACKPVDIISQPIVYFKNKEITIEKTWFVFAADLLPTISPSISTHVRSLKEAPSSAENPIVTVKYESEILSVAINPMPSDAQRYIVVITKETSQSMVKVSDSFNIVKIPSDFYIRSGSMNVKVWLIDHILINQNFDIIGLSICRVADCLLCSDTFSTFHCMTATYQFIIVVLLIFISLALIKACWSLLCFMLVVISNLWIFCRRKQSEETISLKEVNRLSKTALIFAILMGKKVESCENGIFIPATIKDCVTNGDLQECSVQYQLTASIPFPGASSCVTVGDLETSTVLGTYRITYNGANSVLSLTERYVTASWAPLQYSTHYCANESPCTWICGSLGPNDNPDGVFGDTPLSQVPGMSYCHSYGGCAGNGCFSCGSSCTYTRWAILASGDYGRVSQPVGTQTTIFVTIEKTDSEGNFTTTYDGALLTNMPVIDDSNVQITLVGKFSDVESTTFGSNSFVQAGTGTYYGPASIVNQPVASTVGDIQANDPGSLSSYSHDAFIYPPNFASCNQAKYDTCTFPTPGFSALQSAPWLQLPTTIGPNLWYVNNFGQIASDLSNPGAIVVTVDTKTPLEFIRKRSVVCPKVANDAKASGCYNCDRGFAIMVNLMSECESGSVIVSANDDSISLSTFSVVAQTSSQWVTVLGRTTKVSNSFVLSFSGTGGTSDVRIDFDAVKVDSVRNNSYITGTIIQGSNSSSSSFWSVFSDFFTSVGNFFGGNPFGILAEIVVALIVALLLWKVVSGCISEHKSDKIVVQESKRAN